MGWDSVTGGQLADVVSAASLKVEQNAHSAQASGHNTDGLAQRQSELAANAATAADMLRREGR